MRRHAMIERYCDGTAPVARRLDVDPLASHFKEFAALLAHQGYAPATVQSKLQLLDALSRWLKRRTLQTADLDEQRVNLFLKHRTHRSRTRRGDASTVGHLPKTLAPAQVERLLKRCSRYTPIGQRDYTILLLLARLGLRAGEVVAMTLDDLDWEAGEFIVRGKGDRRERLPLPHDVGVAIA